MLKWCISSDKNLQHFSAAMSSIPGLPGWLKSDLVIVVWTLRCSGLQMQEEPHRGLSPTDQQWGSWWVEVTGCADLRSEQSCQVMPDIHLICKSSEKLIILYYCRLIVQYYMDTIWSRCSSSLSPVVNPADDYFKGWLVLQGSSGTAQA